MTDEVDGCTIRCYLTYKITVVARDYKDFEFSGFDIDITQTGGEVIIESTACC
jgi:hypothetical protein